MPEIWPAGVPHHPLDNNIQLDPFRAPLTTDFEDGPQRSRRSTSKNIARMSFTLRMDYSAMGVFRPWLRDVLVDGTLPFTMPIWIGGSFADRLCHFVQPPRFVNMTSDQADIAITLDVEDY